MNAKIEDLVVRSVVTAQPHTSVGEVKKLMKKHGINTVPVIDGADQVEGIVSSADLLDDTADDMPVSQIMTSKVYTVPLYSDVHIAARVMRNHQIHHLVVTHEQKIVGVLSAFDLLKLVEDHRFVMKNPSTPSKKKPKRV